MEIEDTQKHFINIYTVCKQTFLTAPSKYFPTKNSTKHCPRELTTNKTSNQCKHKLQ